MYEAAAAGPKGRWRVYNGVAFFAGWNGDGSWVVGGTWRNAWATDDLDEARRVADRLNALERRRWAPTRYRGH